MIMAGNAVEGQEADMARPLSSSRRPRFAKQVMVAHGGQAECRRRRRGGGFHNFAAMLTPIFVILVAFAIAAGARQVQLNHEAKDGGMQSDRSRTVRSWAFPLELPGDENNYDASTRILSSDNITTNAVFPRATEGSSPLLSINGNGNETDAKGREECDQPYGTLPCSTTVVGNLFLMWAFGSILVTAAKFISSGSELLLEVVNPGLIGGLLLPTLGALPDSLLILVSGIGGDKVKAQEEVVVGIGVLAGSTIMMLTLAWAGSVIAGRCDLTGPREEAVDGKLTLGWSPTKTGVTIDEDARVGAGVMVLTLLPYIIVQIPLIDRHKEQGPTAALVGLIAAWIGLILYSVYQVSSPWLQNKRIQEARINLIHHEFIRDLTEGAKTCGGLLNLDGKANVDAIERLFAQADENHDGVLSKHEILVLLIGLAPHMSPFQADERASHLFNSMDVDNDQQIKREEFVPALAGFLERKRQLDRANVVQMRESEFWNKETEKQRDYYSELQGVVEEEIDGEKGEKKLSPGEVYFWAILYMAIGAMLAGVFADPVVSSVTGFSKSTGIPAFFVAFVVTPLASNSSELVSSLIFAMKKRKRSMSLTISQVYGAISMNNTLCLGIFLTVVYARGLTWEFSSESLVIVIAVLIMGALGYSRRTFPVWMAVPVILIYPLTLAIVFLCDHFFNWK